MTLSSSGNSWLRGSLVFAGLLLAAMVWAYTAGGIFLMFLDRRFDDATPLTLYQYWFHYGDKPNVMKWLSIAGGLGLAAMFAPFAVFFAPAKRSLFGDARFASAREIRKAGLLGENGIIVGKRGSRYLMFDGQQHVNMTAPTRSGKGVGVVIPNLLNWPDSVVVLDIKQENWGITSGVRARYGQECYLFNPAAADYRTHRYNPLAYISDDPNFRIDDVQKIANMLFPDREGTDPIWTATPRSLFLGVVLYLLGTPGKLVTLGQVLRESLVDGDGAAHFANTINERAKAGNPLSSACVRGLNSYISISADNTRSGIITSFRSRLELWMNPLVDAATSANDFDLREVRKRRLSIYIGVTPDNLDRMQPLINLFFQQLIDLNTRELPQQNKDIKYTCLLLMDEFTAAGKLPVLAKGISYIAGYNLRLLPITQSPSQTVEVYGKEAAKTFQTNHALNVVFPPKATEVEAARDISEWLGYQTIKGASESKGKGVFTKKSKSQTISDQRRALLLPQEITSLGQHRELVVLENTPPILANKVVFYREAVFIDRLKAVSPHLAALGSRLPTKPELDEAVSAGELAAPCPRIDVEAHHALAGRNEPARTVKAPQGGAVRTTMVRTATPDDLPKLAKLGLSSFAVDFSGIEAPPPGPIDEAALNDYADRLCREAGISV